MWLGLNWGSLYNYRLDTLKQNKNHHFILENSKTTHFRFTRLSKNCNVHFSHIFSNFILGFNGIASCMQTLGLENEELGIVVGVVNSDFWCGFELFSFVVPGHGWRRFTNDVDVQVEGEANFDSDVFEVCAIDVRFHWKREHCNFKILSTVTFEA